MNMNVYRVTEKQDFGSAGEPGENFEAFNLSEAKRISTRRQKVKGSMLVLEDLTDKPHVVSTKKTSTGNGRTRKRRRGPTKGTRATRHLL